MLAVLLVAGCTGSSRAGAPSTAEIGAAKVSAGGASVTFADTTVALGAGTGEGGTLRVKPAKPDTTRSAAMAEVPELSLGGKPIDIELEGAKLTTDGATIRRALNQPVANNAAAALAYWDSGRASLGVRSLVTVRRPQDPNRDRGTLQHLG